MTEVDRLRYALSEEENEHRFRTRLNPRQLAHAVPQEQPVLVVIGGQTGAGKTATTDMVKQLLDRRGGAVNNNLDFYKPFHPRHFQLMAEDDTTVGAYTSVDGRKWMGKVHAYSIEQRYDVIMESAMTKPADFLEPVQRYRDAGYRIEVVVLAVPEALSRLGVLARYHAEVAATGRGRVIDGQVHDETYRGVLDSVGQIDKERLAHHVFVLRRGNETVHTNALDSDGQWIHEPRAQQALHVERTRPWTEAESYRFAKAIHRLRQAGEHPRHPVPPDWNRQLDQVEQLAHPYRTFDPLTGNAPARGAAAAPNAPPHGRRPRRQTPRTARQLLS